jgi:hypothetical protein
MGGTMTDTPEGPFVGLGKTDKADITQPENPAFPPNTVKTD